MAQIGFEEQKAKPIRTRHELLVIPSPKYRVEHNIYLYTHTHTRTQTHTHTNPGLGPIA